MYKSIREKSRFSLSDRL